jgi:uncharacterized protein YfaS (alpha-2-macroglobulin family)
MSFSRFQPSLRFLLPLALVLLAALVIPFLIGARAQQPAATYTHGNLSVTLPYHSARAGSGKFTAQILDPEDHILGQVERAVDITKGDGAWQQVITPGKAISFEDIVWQRVRYHFEYNDGDNVPAMEGIEPISEILRRPVVRILGETRYLAGSQAAIRVIVSDGTNNDVSVSGTIQIELLLPDRKKLPLFSGRLNRRGTLEAQLHFPAGLTGKYEMRYIADTPIGSTEYNQAVQLEDTVSILLTTEKPLYQPGQTIHVRALALDRAGYKAEGGRKLTFELEDSRGNKVFKKFTETDKFGVASTEFSLADEVNLGTYHLRALMGDSSAPSNTAEVALNVERYVLPKFKVAVEFTSKDNKPKRDYRPGEHVTGTVHANYFFGKPVDHADIAVKAFSEDVAVFEAASATGKTDGEGAYHFDLKLPSYFAGRSFSQGAARALIEATVKDSAAHAETRGEPITISQSSLLITAVPEGGALVPHIENQVYILTSYPDGTPAGTSLIVHLPGTRDQQVSSDSSGVAILRVNPGSGMESIHVEADDHHGNRTSNDVLLQTRTGADQVLLRADRAIFKAGDRIQLKLFSTRARGSAYVDIVRNGQTILTRDLDLENGQAGLSLPVTPEMAGTLDIDAYVLGRDAQPVVDHRLVFVQPADELKIEATANSAVYKPGSDARIHFHVTNSRGEGVCAALGLQVVDEAVFALAEKQPGFAKVFFYLEQEVMKPRYEIHSLSMANVIEPVESSDNGRQDRAARALFSATEMANPAKLDTEFGRSLPQEKYAEYDQRYRTAFTGQVRQIAARLSQNLEKQRAREDIVKAFANLAHENGVRLQDAWNTPLRIEPTGWNQGRNHFYRIRSAGPDRQFDSADDLTVYIEERSGIIVNQLNRGSSSELTIEHDRGAFNDRAEITGTILDPTGAFISGATITLNQLTRIGTGARTRTAHANDAGQFTLAGISAGRYQAEISSAGFNSLVRDFSLEPRDRAILSVTLVVGSMSQTVAVDVMNNPRPVGLAQGVVGGLMVAAPVMFARNSLAEAASMPVNGRSFATFRKQASEAPHIRSYFPEALYINPEIITDAGGNASVSFPIADSITTWRMAMLASTQAGALGSGTSSLKVFQDFFVDLDLPVTLTQGDCVSIPVAVYNYSGKAGEVSLKIQPEDWFSLDNDTSQKTLSVESGRVGSSQFTVNARRIGKFKLSLSAHMDGAGGRDDIVVREIEVIPNGREQDLVFNGRLENSVEHALHFPRNSIADASSVLVRLYPGPLSQVIEGMDSILRMPGGCFEQTSSSTYPNVLALDYMKRTKKLTPEVHAKAEGYIANGYQRLLTFEVPGGGFSWFGEAPANKILTAYGLMEFSDMAKVSEVDPRLIERTRDWLARQQQPDGSWKPDTSSINEGATDRYNTNVLRITAYIAWSLVNTGYRGPAVEEAKRFIQSRSGGKVDNYTLAIIANFAADYGEDRDFTRQSMRALLDGRSESGDQVSWTSEETGVYSTGSSAAIETTGLATQALLKWRQASGTVRKALNFISSKKEASGNWGTTQATIMALRSLLLASQLSTSDVRGSVQVILNGKPLQTLRLTPENNDLLHQFVFKDIDVGKPNLIQLKFEGAGGGLAYQVVGRSFTPWEQKPAADPLSIDVVYDRTKLAQSDIVTSTITIRNHLPKTANMVMVDLGIPPGFDLLSEDLQSFQEKTTGDRSGRLEKFSLTATQAILYFNKLSPERTVTLKYRLRAKYPIRARTFRSRVYEYYDPAVSSTARPVKLVVTEH